MNWTMAQAKHDFERGSLKEVRIVVATENTWSVLMAN
jgi:hypothetical protein